jgi:DNA-binding NtrC family response regulator
MLEIIVLGNQAYKKSIESGIQGVEYRNLVWLRNLRGLPQKLSSLSANCILLQADSMHCTSSTIQTLRTHFPESVLIALAEMAPPDHIISLVKNGLDDYIDLRKSKSRLRVLLTEISNQLQQNTEQSEQRERKYNLNSFIGESQPVHKVRRLIEKLFRKKNITILLRGDTGTGKELAARIIHAKTTKPGTPFVEVNCAAIPDQLLEAELFGYEPGAFTDAKTRKQGLFEVAENGTLFLDEIGHMSANLQVKLLKALEEREFRHLGGTRLLKFEARVIAATNRNLEQAIQDESFRSDLYYRLSVMTITLPSLYERGDDVVLLAEYYNKLFSAEMGQPPFHLSASVLNVLKQYSWPGNVRELRNAMERAILLAEDMAIQPDDLFPSGVPELAPNPTVNIAESQIIATRTADQSLADVESRHILDVLEANNWNRSESARVLGISRPRLTRKIKEYALHHVSDLNN